MRKHEKFIQAHPEVEAWLRNRPQSTRRNFARYLEQFCRAVNVQPEDWRRMEKFEARDLAWKYVEPIIPRSSSVAAGTLMALKSWYRNLRGEQLPLDSGRGGKHYIRIKHEKRAREHIPNKNETFQIIDMASSLRDKALLLLLFQSGVRVNVVEHLTYGDVADQLGEDTITLKITGELDHKLRGRDIPFYYTFLNGEGAETLRNYCKVKHKNSKPETPLFSTRGKKPVTQRWVWQVVKMCVDRAGFKLGTISTHTLRKAFRKIVRQAPIDDDDKEQLMGHVISGSREAYFDKKDVSLIRKAYQKCNFTREIPQSEIEILRKRAEGQNHVIHGLEARITALENLLQKYVEKSS